MNILHRLPLSFWAGAILIVISGAIIAGLQGYEARVRASDIAASRDAVTHSFDVISEILLLDRSLQDSERGQRGYLLTGKQEYLQPYQNSLREIPVYFARVRALTRDNPEQQRRWPVLRQQIEIKLDELKRTIVAQDTQGPEAARRIVETDVGLNSMLAIDGLIGAALATERSLQSERLARSVDTDRATANIALITGALGLLGILAGLWFSVMAARSILQTHDALDRTRAELAQAQKLEALGQLTGGIAHDFNNLLQGILGGISILQRRLPPVSEDMTDWMAMIRRNADRAASLTQRLLAFSRRQPLSPRTLDLNRVVTGMRDMLHQSLGENIEVEAVPGSGLWLAELDAGELETAILNLAINARDAMPDGGKLTIETSNTFLDEIYSAKENVKPGQYVMVAVSDTGTGMSKETVEKAFEPFFTTKPPGKGTGLGLSQVYGFVKQSQGHIKIYSEPGEGTSIKLYFPRIYSSAPEMPAAEIRQPVPVKSAECILVVEDDGDVRSFTASVLAETGYRVFTAGDADSALQLLEKETLIRLTLTDVGLPGKNGRQLADEARKKWPNLRVVFMTGYARNAIVHGGRLDPGVDLIVKPFTERALTTKLRSVLDRS